MSRSISHDTLRRCFQLCRPCPRLCTRVAGMMNIQHEQISHQGGTLLQHKSPHARLPKPQITTCTNWEHRGNEKLQRPKR